MLMAFDQVNYIYPCTKHPAIDNFSLQIPPYRRCALIGANGCGKTTLLRLANGLYRPQQGTICWQNQPLRYDHRSLNQLRQKVGLVFQDPEQQLVAPTVAEDIAYGLCNLRLPKEEIAVRVQQTLEQFQLTDLASEPVNYLSLGQKKRLSLAAVMVLKPQLLLLDEPTAYLDPGQTRNLLASLAAIAQAGTTILLATHNLDFAYTWADWIVVMAKGRLILEGPPAQVFAQSQLLEDLDLGVPLAVSLLASLGDILVLDQQQKTRLQQRLQNYF